MILQAALHRNVHKACRLRLTSGCTPWGEVSMLGVRGAVVRQGAVRASYCTQLGRPPCVMPRQPNLDSLIILRDSAEPQLKLHLLTFASPMHQLTVRPRWLPC